MMSEKRIAGRARRSRAMKRESYCSVSATKRSSPLRVGDEEQRPFAAFLLELVTRFCRGVLPTCSWETSTMTSPALRRFSAAGDCASTPVIDHALDGILDCVAAAARDVGHVGEVEAERLLHHRLLFGSGVFLRRERGLLLVATSTAELTGLFLALRTITTSTSLPTGVSATTRRQVAHLANVLAVELDDDVTHLDAAGFARALLATPATRAPCGA